MITMPHYKDGTEAKVGDQVVGRLYNTEGTRAGTIISITPGAESCNAMVAFIEAVPVDPAADNPIASRVPRMAVHEHIGDDPGIRAPRYRIVQGEAHGSAGARFALFECADYCAVNELTKVS